MTAPQLSLPADVVLAGYRELSLDELRAAGRQRQPWLWRGYLAPGTVTLLTSLWKSGKTTLVAVLLDRLRTGGELAGLPLAAGRAVVVSEESPALWDLRCQKFAFGEHVRWVCRPFAGKPTRAEWLALLDRLAALRRNQQIDLAVIDPLASFLPGHDENSAAGMLEALLPLQRLTALGLSVLVLHHPRKGVSAPGLAARGSGALPGFADVVVEMRRCGLGGAGDRRRLLEACSRYEETPRQLVIELNAEGTDYEVVGDLPKAESSWNWEVLRAVLERADRRLTRQEILERWPVELPAPHGGSLWRWVARAVDQGHLVQQGTGKRGDPYRYCLPEVAERLRRERLAGLPELEPLEPLTGLERELCAEATARLARSLRKRRRGKG